MSNPIDDTKNKMTKEETDAMNAQVASDLEYFHSQGIFTAEGVKADTEKNIRATKDDIQRRINTWMFGDNTGISSKTIAAFALGVPYAGASQPWDPSDFGRCHKLLQAVPELYDVLPKLAEKYPEWKYLVQEWDHLTKLYLRDRASGKCSELYREMKYAELLSDRDAGKHDANYYEKAEARNFAIYFNSDEVEKAVRSMRRSINIVHDVRSNLAGWDKKAVVVYPNGIGHPVIGNQNQEVIPNSTHTLSGKKYHVALIDFPASFTLGGQSFTLQNELKWSHEATNDMTLKSKKKQNGPKI